MGQEFEDQDLRESTFWGVDLRDSTFRDVNFTGVSMKSVWLVDVNIDGTVDRLVINGVDVTEYVATHDPWGHLRNRIRPADAAGMVEAWGALDEAWRETITAVAALPDATRHASVDGEWSFVQTLRHLVFGMDKWFTHPVLGEGFHPAGLPNTGSIDFPWPGLDRQSSASFEEAVEMRAGRADRLATFVATADDAALDRAVDVLENGPHPVRTCIEVVFEEAFEHLRYARRDLAALAAMA